MAYVQDSIRGLSVVIIERDGKVLVSPGYDKVKDKRFYRFLGGGIDFNETSLHAIEREIKEELDLELKNYQLLNISENIFTFNGEPGHEICFIYKADFKDESNYKRDDFVILDAEDGEVIWLKLNLDNIKMITPPGAEEYLKEMIKD